MVGVLEVLEGMDSFVLFCLVGLTMLGAVILLFVPAGALKGIKVVAVTVSFVVAVLAIYIFV